MQDESKPTNAPKDEPQSNPPKPYEHPAAAFLRETRAARALRLANMPKMISMPSLPSVRLPKEKPPPSPQG